MRNLGSNSDSAQRTGRGRGGRLLRHGEPDSILEAVASEWSPPPVDRPCTQQQPCIARVDDRMHTPTRRTLEGRKFWTSPPIQVGRDTVIGPIGG